jgi:polysaccharide biosynthesis/export protein
LRTLAALVFLAVSAALNAAPWQTPAAPAGAAASQDYVLQRGDDVDIKAYNIPEIDLSAHIRPDGKITVLLLNDIVAAGLTPAQLTATLTEGYSQHFRNPRIAVIVRGLSSENVYVGGEVLKPGEISIRNNLTALQAVVDAGGLKENTGAEATITVMRTVPGAATQYFTLSAQDVVDRKQPDIPLRSGDVVYVAKTFIQVYVGGEVTRPGLVPLSGQMTLMGAIAQAGGLTIKAQAKSLVLIRKNDTGAPVVSTIATNAVFAGKADMVLKPYDIVYVPKSKIANIDQIIDQYIRQVIPFNVSGGFTYILGQGIIQ